MWQSKPSITYPIKRLTTDKRDNHFHGHSKSIWKNPDDIFHKKQGALKHKEIFSIWQRLFTRKDYIISYLVVNCQIVSIIMEQNVHTNDSFKMKAIILRNN